MKYSTHDRRIRPQPSRKRKNDDKFDDVMIKPDDPLLMPRIVQEILNNLAEAKKSRTRFEVATILDNIHFRVRQALAHSGLSTTIHPTESERELKSPSINAPPKNPGQLSGQQKQARANQRKVLDKIQACLQGCYTQQDMLADISDWLESHDDLLSYTVPVDEVDAERLEAEQSMADIQEALTYVSRVVGKIRALGYVLMKEAGFFPTTPPKEVPGATAEGKEVTSQPDPVDDQATEEINAFLKSLPVASKKEAVESIKILEENVVLADPTLFQPAVANVIKVLMKAVRAVAHNHDKNAIRDALRQFKIIMKVGEAKQHELKQQINELSKLKNDVEEAQNAVSVWKEEYEKADLRNIGLDKKVHKLEKTVEQLEHEKLTLEEEIEDMKTDHEKKLEEMSQRHMSVVTFSSHNSIIREASFGSRSLLKATESAITTATKQLQDDVDELRLSLKQRDQTIEELELALAAEKEEREKLAEAQFELTPVISQHETTTTIEKVVVDTKFKKEMLKKIKELINEKEAVGRQLGRIKSEMHHKSQLLKYQDHCIKELKDELGQIDVEDFLKGNTKLHDGSTPDAEVKRMVQRMQKDFQNELGRLKAHIEKEKSRHDASMSKQDQSHKDQALKSHKQSLHLIRAINRFKDTVAQTLDREGLHVGANDIRRLPALVEEEVPGDPKKLMGQMAGSAVELLANIGIKLSQALLNKRLEIKDNATAMRSAMRDLEVQTELAQKAKHSADLLGEKLNVVMAKLSMAESTLTEMRRVEDERHKGISDRYRNLMKQYIYMQSGMDKLQKKYRSTVKYKDRAMKSIMTNKESIAKLLEDQQAYISSIEEHVKMNRDEHNKQLALSIHDQKQNLKLLDQALKENKITQETHAATAQILKKSMQIPLLKFQNLVQRYVAYRKYKDMKDQFNKQSGHQLLGSNRGEFNSLQQHIDLRLEKANRHWKTKCSIIENRRKDLFVEMDQLCNYVIAETGILLIQPDPRLRSSQPPKPPEPPASTTVTKSTRGPAIPEATTAVADSSAMNNSVPVGRGVHGLSLQSKTMDLQGTKLCLEHAKEELWHLPQITTDNKIAAVEVPRIVDIEVNQIMRAAKLALHRAGKYKRSLSVSSVEVFDYGNPANVVPVAKVLRNYGHHCYGNQTLLSSNLSSSDMNSSAVDSTVQNGGDQVVSDIPNRLQ